MENVKKFYDALANDEAMKKRAETLNEKHKDSEPDEVAARADIIAFAKSEGFDFTQEDLDAYANQVKPLTDEQLEAVAGGKAGCGCTGWGGGGGKDKYGETFACACVGGGMGCSGSAGDPHNPNFAPFCVCAVVGGGGA